MLICRCGTILKPKYHLSNLPTSYYGSQQYSQLQKIMILLSAGYLKLSIFQFSSTTTFILKKSRFVYYYYYYYNITICI